MKKEDLIINRISKILGIKKNHLVEKKDFTKFDDWDSLKHLEIITFLDSIIKKKDRAKIDLSKITNLKKILSLIK